jgi:hypothetical protein
MGVAKVIDIQLACAKEAQSFSSKSGIKKGPSFEGPFPKSIFILQTKTVVGLCAVRVNAFNKHTSRFSF